MQHNTATRHNIKLKHSLWSFLDCHRCVLPHWPSQRGGSYCQVTMPHEQADFPSAPFPRSGFLKKTQVQNNPWKGSFSDLMLCIDFLCNHTIYRSHNDRSILVHNADLLTISIPAHAPHHWLVPVIDHLFVPRTSGGDKERQLNMTSSLQINPYFSLTAVLTFVKHPHNDESGFITGRQLLVLLIPCHHLHCTCIWLYDKKLDRVHMAWKGGTLDTNKTYSASWTPTQKNLYMKMSRSLSASGVRHGLTLVS